MDLRRLPHPRTISVVGAPDRHDSYAGQTLLNLKAFGYRGEVWEVKPGRSEAPGVPCFPALSDLPSPPNDVAIVPLPASPERVERALLSLRGAAVLTGGRGRARLDVAAAARLAARTGELPLEGGLTLTELNPVLVYERGAVVVDALAAAGRA
jgi:acyl-CoA synthetase (NDP forming)